MFIKLKTILFDRHVKLKANIVDFHGWEMPIYYSGIVNEHIKTRTLAGLFDISHMGRIEIQDSEAAALLQNVLTIDVEKLKAGQAKYCFMLNPSGGILDDMIVYKMKDKYLLVVNASNRSKILEHIKGCISRQSIKINDLTTVSGMVALQGPLSVKLMKDLFSLDLKDMKYYNFSIFNVLNTETVISRTGYTGEDGFEMIAPNETVLQIWDKILNYENNKIAPAGLGARDTLRLEAGMPLYGNDIDETRNPIEAGLTFAISMNKPKFIGKSAIEGIVPNQKLTGFVSSSKRIARHGFEIFKEDKKIGLVTSGTWSPTLEKSVGMCYVDKEFSEPGNRLLVDIRGKKEEITIQTIPFYRREK